MKLCKFNVALGICTQAMTSFQALFFLTVITVLLPKSKTLAQYYHCLTHTNFPGKKKNHTLNIKSYKFFTYL